MVYQSNGFDKYWRLIQESSATEAQLRGKLKYAGYDMWHVKDYEELRRLERRVDFNYLCYERCGYYDLMKFVNDRLGWVPPIDGSKRALVDILHRLDDEQTFYAFMDLPVELRTRIHSFYISDFNWRALESPSQPPLARTCRLLRAEVLPVFYHECSFQIQFIVSRVGQGAVRRFRMSYESVMFLSSLAPGCVGHLRNVEVLFKDYPPVSDITTLYVNFDLPCASFVFSFEAGGMGMLHEYMENGAPSIGRMWEVLFKIVKREGKRGLRMEDFYSMARVVEQGSNDMEQQDIDDDP